ncbi:bacteriohopanetetrol glucosamine biosynthesis glycosyltransferase HpnI [Chthonomonas calidirosea]|uniref:bacteriohopanetetrol glucosamine biosynthesis glycosyltransferase HpnI n=1 Tax=Chthonomonas calidirosea TaxID=454171 RepID=UPI0006ECAA01|nr:bacteriohopanetetrol glucosamine biosynthesis glycosyltransferase HpnI [Chthonomonas calidirosea]CEK12476.1 hopanoid biosynthesis associated glycosyl transferase protein HpnI [Chthonomonas calidirosea]
MKEAIVLARLLLDAGLLGYLAYACLTVVAAWQWRHSAIPPNQPLALGISVLKPVCGVDPYAEENFRSFIEQDYPLDRFQVLFTAFDPDDPALAVAVDLKKRYPHHNIQVVFSSSNKPEGNNRKVANLLALLPFAEHELLVIADSDMRVGPDYLRAISAHLLTANSQQSVGLVTCPYRGALAHSFAAQLEALGIGADFIPSALVSRMLEGVGFAFGSTIAIPKTVLERIGGLQPLLNEIADDFLLGQKVRQAGYKVVIANYMVDDVLGAIAFKEMWSRRLRWARTVRACRPMGYAGSLITHGFALSLLWALIQPSLREIAVIVPSVLLVRLLTVFMVSFLTDDPAPRKRWYLLPVSDLISFAIYVTSWCGNRVQWRGERFRLQAGGKLERI